MERDKTKGRIILDLETANKQEVYKQEVYQVFSLVVVIQGIVLPYGCEPFAITQDGRSTLVWVKQKITR